VAFPSKATAVKVQHVVVYALQRAWLFYAVANAAQFLGRSLPVPAGVDS
jgi:hypothetical protein